MTFFDKLMFWKKEPEPMIGTLERTETSMPEMPSEYEPSYPKVPPAPMPQAFTPPYPQQTFQPAQYPSADKDMQLISAKLDTIKAQLDTIAQRLAKIERIAEEGEAKYPYR